MIFVSYYNINVFIDQQQQNSNHFTNYTKISIRTITKGIDNLSCTRISLLWARLKRRWRGPFSFISVKWCFDASAVPPPLCAITAPEQYHDAWMHRIYYFCSCIEIVCYIVHFHTLLCERILCKTVIFYICVFYTHKLVNFIHIICKTDSVCESKKQ